MFPTHGLYLSRPPRYINLSTHCSIFYFFFFFFLISQRDRCHPKPISGQSILALTLPSTDICTCAVEKHRDRERERWCNPFNLMWVYLCRCFVLGAGHYVILYHVGSDSLIGYTITHKLPPNTAHLLLKILFLPTFLHILLIVQKTIEQTHPWRETERRGKQVC